MDSFKQEELAEKRELYRGVHKPLKAWYLSEKVPQSLRDKYGEIPMFWQELEEWPSTKIIVKLYLTIEEKIQAGAEVDVLAIEERITKGSQATNDGDTQAKIIAGDEPNNADEGSSKRKRRNRWGDKVEIDPVVAEQVASMTDNIKSAESQTATLPSNEDGSTTGATNELKKPKKSRFSPAVGSIMSAAQTQEVAQQIVILNMKMQHLTEKLMTVAIDAARIEQDPHRDPSPPPRYDANGKRTNTREMRMRDDLMKERVKVIEELIRINPSYLPPPDYVKQKPFRKLYIPVKEYPMYNFIGLLIGPRGNTQRSMEQEYGVKISIRGKGSVKDGRKPKMSPDDDDELHVHIQAETEANVERAAAVIGKILTPVDDEINEHKQKQLRELALINGTLREDEYCPICGEKGHRQFECTNRTVSFKPSGVKCSICGDLSHPTRDCPLKDSKLDKPDVSIDQEYSSFMAELDGKSSAVSGEAKESDGNGSNTSGTIFVQPASNPSSGQTTIVMPAYTDKPLYPQVAAQVWPGSTYIPPPMAATYGQTYPAYQPAIPGVAAPISGAYYPPPQDYYSSYPQPAWSAAPVAPTPSGPRPPYVPPVPVMPPPPSNPK